MASKKTELEPIDLAFTAMMVRWTPTESYATPQDDGTVIIEDQYSTFELYAGELTCMHKSWYEDEDDVYSSNPDATAMSIKYAFCPDCDTDVSLDVGYGEPDDGDYR